jgi:purine-binding chemotaxis protein CheW
VVDLVKIRKKAKKQAGESGQAPARAREGDEPLASGPRAHAEEESRARPPAPGDSHPATSGTSLGPVRTADAESLPLHAENVPTPEGSTKLDRFKEDAGKRREGFFAAEAVTEAAEQLELLTFHIAGEQYALNIEHIVEIVPPRDATRVPNADESIVGIISLRGTIVTIVDVRQTLRHPPSGALGADARVVVVQYGGETLGFVVDRVVRVVKVDRTAVEPHPIVHSSEQSEAIHGVFRHANALTILLDFDKLLAARHGTYL